MHKISEIQVDTMVYREATRV